MTKLIKIIITTACFGMLSSCTTSLHNPFNINSNSNDETSTPPSFTSPDLSSFTCDDLEKVNNILFLTFTYSKGYDLDSDGEVTVKDKLLLENSLLTRKAACVTRLRGCDELPAVLAEVETWSGVPAYETLKLAIAYSIIFNESGERCANDFGTGSFIGDVNNNGYIDCNDPLELQQYIIGNPPIVYVDPTLGDVNGSGTRTTFDAVLIRTAMLRLIANYADYLGACPALP